MTTRITRATRLLLISAVLYAGSGTALAHESAAEGKQATAAASQLKRSVVIESELTGIPGKRMLAWVAEIAPGASTGWHYHPNDEFVYVLEGTARVEMKGRASTIVRAGETIHTPAKAVHRVINVSGTDPAKGLVFGLTAKGEPLAVEVKK